jgi:acyl carrier protein
MSPTRAEVERLFRARFGDGHELLPTTNLVTDLELDSIQQLELVVELENHFAIELEPDEGQEIVTIGDLVAWIDRSRGAVPRDE